MIIDQWNYLSAYKRKSGEATVRKNIFLIKDNAQIQLNTLYLGKQWVGKRVRIKMIVEEIVAEAPVEEQSPTVWTVNDSKLTNGQY